MLLIFSTLHHMSSFDKMLLSSPANALPLMQNKQKQIPHTVHSKIEWGICGINMHLFLRQKLTASVAAPHFVKWFLQALCCDAVQSSKPTDVRSSVPWIQHTTARMPTYTAAMAGNTRDQNLFPHIFQGIFFKAWHKYMGKCVTKINTSAPDRSLGKVIQVTQLNS